VLDLKEEGEIYVLDPTVRSELATESTVGTRVFFTAINRQNVLFLWPIRLPGEDGRIDEWNRSAMEAATMATEGWVRVASNMSLGAYEVYQATADLPDPEWPELSFEQILQIAFKDRMIESLDHAVLQRLRGES